MFAAEVAARRSPATPTLIRVHFLSPAGGIAGLPFTPVAWITVQGPNDVVKWIQVHWSISTLTMKDAAIYFGWDLLNPKKWHAGTVPTLPPDIEHLLCKQGPLTAKRMGLYADGKVYVEAKPTILPMWSFFQPGNWNSRIVPASYLFSWSRWSSAFLSAAVHTELLADAISSGVMVHSDIMKCLANHNHHLLLSLPARLSTNATDVTAVMKQLLALYGPPGSKEVLEVLSLYGHRLLQWAVRWSPVATVQVVIASYGPPGCPEMAEALAALGHVDLRRLCVGEFQARPRPATLAVVLPLYGPPGCPALLNVLAAGRHALLRHVCREMPSSRKPCFDVLLSAYGPPGCPAVLEALAANDNEPLRRLCMVSKPCVEALCALLAAYGPAGCPAVLEALAFFEHQPLRWASRKSRRPAAVAALLAAYGPPGCPAVLEALARSTAIVEAFYNDHVASVDLLARAYGLTLPSQNKIGRLRDELGEDMVCLLEDNFDSVKASVPLSMLFVRDPDYWRVHNDDYYDKYWRAFWAKRIKAGGPANPARALLSPDTRWATIAPTMLVFKRLPGRVGIVLRDWFLQHPWLLFYVNT